MGGTMHQDLWNAEISGILQTASGSVRWRLVIPAREDALAVDADITGNVSAAWRWHAEQADSPCVDTYGKQDTYVPNPPAQVEDSPSGGLCIQPLRAGGETATAWSIERRGATLRFRAVVRHSHPGSEARSAAEADLRRFSAQPFDDVIRRHREWWHAYYPKSFVSLPDPDWERFYWMQIYKLGCATREDGPIIDCLGPWFRKTAWPGLWWNMNVQHSYWPVYASNRLELGESLCRSLDRNMDNLIANAPPELRHDSAAIWIVTAQDCRGDSVYDLHTLPWACHNYWLQYRYTLADGLLRDRLYPLLRRAIQFIAHRLEPKEPGPDGRPVLHLCESQWGEQGVVRDSPSALALLRWGCETLLWSCVRLKIEDPLAPAWRDILARLAPLPADDRVGLLHATHSMHPGDYLLAVYPLHQLTAEDPATARTLQLTLDYWCENTRGRRGAWLCTHGAAMLTCSGRHAEAIERMDQVIRRVFTPNTFYHEDGNPVIEGPLAWAAVVHELLLQSWGGVIRIFPGVPASWGDTAFENLRAEGAFLVSAERRNGKTRTVRVKSLAGEPCRIRPGLEAPIACEGAVRGPLRAEADGMTYVLPLRRGEEVVLSAGAAKG